MQKLSLNKQMIDCYPGYELKIRDKDLNLQDFLTELNDFIETAELERLWPGGNTRNCYACDLCCHEPLPLSLIDVINICQAMNVSFREVFRYLWVEVQDNIVDITLRRSKGGSCIFLQKNRTCAIYAHRPFLCQSYICCQTSSNVERIRSEVVNQGMDELIRKSLVVFESRGLEIPVNKGNKRYINKIDWPVNVFTGKSHYSEVLLKDILPSDLMNLLLL